MFSSVRGTRASPGTPPPEGPPQAARAKAPKPSAWKRPRERPNRLGRNETRAWIQVVRGTMTYRATPPARKKRTRRRSAHGSGAPVSDRHRGRRPRNRTPPVTHTTPRPPPLRRRPTPNPVRQRNAGLRPASRPQAAKLRPRRGNPKRRRRSDVRAPSCRRAVPFGEGAMGRKDALEFRPLHGRCRSETGAPLPCALRAGCRNAVSSPSRATKRTPPCSHPADTASATCASRRTRYCDM